MKSPIIILLTTLLAACSGCSNREIQLRVKNVSLFQYDSLTVNTSGGEGFYGTVAFNQISEYKTFDFAYRYALLKLYINDTAYMLQPIDYAGETKLKSGKYTYEINVNQVAREISLNCIKG